MRRNPSFVTSKQTKKKVPDSQNPLDHACRTNAIEFQSFSWELNEIKEVVWSMIKSSISVPENKKLLTIELLNRSFDAIINGGRSKCATHILHEKLPAGKRG